MKARRPGAEQIHPSHSMKWRPIETAPKDGTKVLIWSPGPGTETASYYQGTYRKEWRAGGDSRAPRAPRYWMPTPADPETENEQEEQIEGWVWPDDVEEYRAFGEPLVLHDYADPADGSDQAMLRVTMTLRRQSP